MITEIHSPHARQRTILLLSSLVTVLLSPPSWAQENKKGVVSYEPSFFAQYNPITALDIVDRVPGFKLEKQDAFGGQETVRGFGGNASDVLINGKRPSTKSTPIENILERYAAEDVIRVDLIRGATGALDSSKSSVVVNVILKERDGRGSIPWEASLHIEDGHFIPGGQIAYSDKVASTEYTLSFKRDKYDYDFGGPEIFTNSFGPDEVRDEISFEDSDTWTATAETETQFANGDFLRFNSQVSWNDYGTYENSMRLSEGALSPDVVDQNTDGDSTAFEIGGDYERELSERFRAKAIALATRKTSSDNFRQDDHPAMDVSTWSRFDTKSKAGETIGRLEFDWSGWKNHTLQFGGELVHNFLESEAILEEDDGSGPILIPLPGSNTRVKEIRGELFLTDSWSVNDKIILDAGLAVEYSEIKQSGDVDLVRDFTYTKPSLSLTYSPSDKTQWRLRIEKEVGQLDFNDFVSAANFQDDDLAAGNPELEPEQTWVLEVTYERRFGAIGVIEIAPFYHMIEDVEDFVPIADLYEAPGNIGDGKRWGVNTNLTMDLDLIGVKNARLDISYSWQDSSATDPVTGRDRPLSREEAWEYDISLRKDFPKARTSIGIGYEDNDEQVRYGLDEITSSYYSSGLSTNFTCLDPPRDNFPRFLLYLT
jgi:outer membrane cobalamin receptor